VKEDAKGWEIEQRGGKRKRDRDDDDIETLSQTSKRTTRTQSRSANGSPFRKSAPSAMMASRLEVSL